jgi:hypothetical protein
VLGVLHDEVHHLGPLAGGDIVGEGEEQGWPLVQKMDQDLVQEVQQHCAQIEWVVVEHHHDRCHEGDQHDGALHVALGDFQLLASPG